MDTVESIANYTNLDIKQACQELLEFNETGILNDGEVRRLMRNLVDEGYPTTHAYSIASDFIKTIVMRMLVEDIKCV